MISASFNSNYLPVLVPIPLRLWVFEVLVWSYSTVKVVALPSLLMVLRPQYQLHRESSNIHA